MIVRRAEPRDLGAITAIYNHWVRTSAATFDIDPFTEDERRPWFEEHGDDYPLLVAERDGEVVGYACLSRFQTKPAYGQTATTTVYLAEAARGAPNEASVRLHRRFGFERIGVMHEVGWKFERWHDVEWFELRL